MGRGILAGLGMVVAFAAGVALGLTLATPGAAPVPAAPPPAAASDAAPDAPQAATAPKPEAHASTPATPRARGDRAPDAPAPPAAGDGAIRGRVRDASGNGVAGIAVVAWAEPAGAQDDRETWMRDDGPPEERIRAFERYARGIGATVRRTATADDGTYSIAALADLPHNVSASGAGWSVLPRSWAESRGVRPGGTVDFVAEPRSELALDVRLPDGSAPERAMVRLARGSAIATAEWTAARPRIEAAPGSAELTVTAGAHEEFRAVRSPFTIPSGADARRDPVVVQLAARPGLLVTPRLPAGFETLAARVRVFTAAGSEIGGPQSPMHVRRSDDEQGSREFLDLPPGRYAVTASLDGETEARVEADVIDGPTAVAIDVPAAAPARIVAVEVAPADAVSGRPEFRWTCEGERQRAEYAARTVARGGGRWDVLRPAPSDAPSSMSMSGEPEAPEKLRWRLTLRVDGAVRGAADCPPGTTAAAISIAEPAYLDVAVEGIAESGAAGPIAVSALLVKRGERGGMTATGVASGVADADGRCRLGPLPPGELEVHCSTGDGRFGGCTVAFAAVRVAAGENEVRIRLPRLHGVTVDGGAALAGRMVRVEPARDDASRPTMPSMRVLTLDGAGRAQVTGLPAGAYTAQAGSKRVEFTVPGDTVVRIE